MWRHNVCHTEVCFAPELLLQPWNTCREEGCHEAFKSSLIDFAYFFVFYTYFLTIYSIPWRLCLFKHVRAILVLYICPILISQKYFSMRWATANTNPVTEIPNGVICVCPAFACGVWLGHCCHQQGSEWALHEIRPINQDTQSYIRWYWLPTKELFPFYNNPPPMN